MKSKDILVSAVGRLRRLARQEPEAATYAEEAVACLQADAFRMAVVAAWQLLTFVIYLRIGEYGLPAFVKFVSTNNIPIRGGGDIQSIYDLNKIEDSQLISACHDLGFFDRNVKSALQVDLQTRNGCAHPSQLSMSETTTVPFVHALLDSIEVIRESKVKGKPLTLVDNLMKLDDSQVKRQVRTLSLSALQSSMGEMLDEAELVSTWGQADDYARMDKFLTAVFESRASEGERIAIFEIVVARHLSGKFHRSIKAKILPALVVMVRDIGVKKHALQKGYLENFVSEFAASDSFDEAAWTSSIVSEFGSKLTRGHVEALCRAILLNDQISKSFGAQSHMKDVLSRNRNNVDSGLLEQVRKVPGFEF